MYVSSSFYSQPSISAGGKASNTNTAYQQAQGYQFKQVPWQFNHDNAEQGKDPVFYRHALQDGQIVRKTSDDNMHLSLRRSMPNVAVTTNSTPEPVTPPGGKSPKRSPLVPTTSQGNKKDSTYSSRASLALSSQEGKRAGSGSPFQDAAKKMRKIPRA